MPACGNALRSGDSRARRGGVIALILCWFTLAPGAAVAGDASTVSSVDSLLEALENARPGDSIDILPGDYFVPRTGLDREGLPDAPITVQAAIPGTVTLWASDDTVFLVSGSYWRIRELSFQGHGGADHALHIRGPAHGLVVESNRFRNFHAALRAQRGERAGEFPDHVRVLRNIFVNDAPRRASRPIAAISVTGGQDWIIEENLIADIGVAAGAGGNHAMAAYVKGGARGTIIDRNVVACEWRHKGGQRVGLSLGGGGTSRADFDRREQRACLDDCPETVGGRLTNNIVYNCPNAPGIYLRRADDTLVAHNTVFNAFGVQAHYPQTRAAVSNNLISGTVWARDGSHVEETGNRTTGWFSRANYLASIKHRLESRMPEQRVIGTEWTDRVIRGLHGAVISVLDRLADSRLGKGVSRFDAWLKAPEHGDFRLDAPTALIGEGTPTPAAPHDFCGHSRSAPGDIGALEYKAGGCELTEELAWRHGDLFISLLQDDGSRPPPDWHDTAPEPGATTAATTPSRVIEADPSDYRSLVRELEPGDHLRLAAGDYPRPLDLRGLRGTAERPIVVSGPAEGAPAVLWGRRGANTVRLRDTAHVAVRHLTLDGGRHNIAGVVLDRGANYAHDITLEHLTIRNYDGSQGNSGITTRAPAWNWTVRNNEIRRVGTGIYFGRPDGTAPFIGGLIENNVVAETVGYAMQIKHQNIRHRLPGMPVEPRQTIIRHNVFSKATGGSGGDRARPNLLLGHFPPDGPGQHDRYLVYGNLFYENPHERLFQGEGNLALYNNLFVNTYGDALIVRRHNDVPKDVRILNNTVLARRAGIQLEQPDDRYRQVIAGNAVFAESPVAAPGEVRVENNFAAPFDAAVDHLQRPYADWSEIDLSPVDGALRRDEPLPAYGTDLPEFDRDPNGRPRSREVYGAHAGSGGAGEAEANETAGPGTHAR